VKKRQALLRNKEGFEAESSASRGGILLPEEASSKDYLDRR